MGIWGQDWSSYQSSAPETSGLSFAFIKVTEGLSYTSPIWISQRAVARKAGLIVGFYHYPHIKNSATAEAEHFLSQINLVPGDVLCLDWEWYGQSVTDQQARAYKTAWIDHVRAKAPGHRIIVYADRNNWLNVDKDGNAGDGLWIADYVTAGQPRIKADWMFHQYSDTPVDKDYCPLPSREALRAWATLTSPTPEEDIVTPEDIKAIAAAVWSHPLPNINPDGTRAGSSKEAFWWLVWQDVFQGQLLGAIADAKLTPEKLRQALADGTLQVQVTVKGA